MLIKKATSDQLGELYNLYIVLENNYNVKPSNQEISEWKSETCKLICNPKKGGIFIAIDSGKSIGYLSYYFIRGVHGSLNNCAFLSELYVKPRHRKKGVATKLIRRFFRIKLPSFVKRLTVTASPEATGVIQLYEKLGFKIRGKTKAGNIKLGIEL